MGLTGEAAENCPQYARTYVWAQRNRGKSTIYIGKVTFRGVEYEGRHQPLVTEDVFYKVQDILDGRSVAGERRRTHENYLKGTIFCGRCHSRLLFTLSKGQGGDYYYFYCRGRQQGNGCRQPHLAVDDVDAAVERFYRTIQLEPEQIEAVRQRLHDELGELRRTREREAKRLTTKAQRLKVAQDRLIEGLYGGLPMELFKEEQARLARETLDTNRRLAASQTRFEKVQETIDKALTIDGNLHDLYRRAPDQVRRLINQAVFENIWVTAGLLRGARVAGATFAEPLSVLAADLPEHVSRETQIPELVFFGGGFE